MNAQTTPAPTGYTNMPIPKVPSWHGTIAVDALLNNMATGLFLAAAFCEFAAPAVFVAVAKVAYPIALVLLLADLAFLVTDLGDPLRFHHMLRVFKPYSPMSLGTWCLTIFSLPLTVAAILSLLAIWWIDFEWVRIAAVIVGLLPAFGSAAYKGVLLSTNAQPGWKDARWMGGYLTNSAVLIGCGELLLLSSLMGQAPAVHVLRIAFAVLLVINVIPLALLFRNLQPAHARLYTPRQEWNVAALIFLCGTLVPLALTLISGNLGSIAISVVLLLVASWAIRLLYVNIPHLTPGLVASPPT